jgi:hypothetical protein
MDPNSYNDTGATDDITSDLVHLAIHERYNGGEQVQVGNGAGLDILHTGHSSISTAERPLVLRNILHVPQIAKHLLSVHKFTLDNNVFFEFHPWHFYIKDPMTQQTLLARRSEGGLYPLKPSDVADLKQALVTRSSSTRDQWHARLGHPSMQIVQSILRLNNIPCSSESFMQVCNSCQLAKSHQLPYASSIHRALSPLELIYSNVWVLHLNLLVASNTILVLSMILVNLLGPT